MKMTGKVKFFHAEKGWGFITSEGGSDIFVHYSDIQSKGFRSLAEGQPVEYELAEGNDGKEKAINVIATGEAPTTYPPRRNDRDGQSNFRRNSR